MTMQADKAALTTCCRAFLELVEAPDSGATRELHIGLQKFDSDLGLLEKAWSEMAIRNLTNDLYRRLSTHAGPWPARLKGPRDNLIRNLRDNLGEHASRRVGRYSDVMCLGYQVTTLRDSGYFSEVSQRRSKHDQWLDMHNRCQRLIAAIQQASKLADSSPLNNKKVLKVFMAPEFYFRGVDGAYDLDVISGDGRRPGILDLMRAELNQPKYRDWLLVLGTAIGAATEPETGKAQIINVAFVWKENHVHVVTKEFIADQDFEMRKPRWFERNMKKPSERDYKKHNWKVAMRGKNVKVDVQTLDNFGDAATRFDDERMGGCIFTIDGIVFGMEICLDHKLSRLRKAAGVHVQLIPAAGMSVLRPNVVDEGLIFNVDGMEGNLDARMHRYRDPVMSREGFERTATASGHVVPGVNGPDGKVRLFGPFPLPRGNH